MSVHIRKDDVVVVRVPGAISRQVEEHIREQVRRELAIDNKILVLADGMSIEVLSADVARAIDGEIPTGT